VLQVFRPDWRLAVLLGLALGPAALVGQSAAEVRGLQVDGIAAWLESNPRVSICLAPLEKEATWRTSVLPEVTIRAPTDSEMASIDSELSSRFPTRVLRTCVDVRHGTRLNDLDFLLERRERAENCSAVRGLIVAAESRGASPEELNEIFRSNSRAPCYPIYSQFTGPYGERAARIGISTPVFVGHDVAIVFMAPNFTPRRNNYLFCSFRRAGDRWLMDEPCERMTYTH